jgi:NADH dehydrogenase
MGALSPGDIAQPLRLMLRAPNIQVIMKEVTGFDLDRRNAHFQDSAEIEYDYLILATGSTHSYFGKEDWATLAPGLKTIEDAIEIRRRVLLVFEQAEAEAVATGKQPQLNFVVIGGGPTGVELAGALSDIAKHYLRNDFKHITPENATITLLEGSPEILKAYPEDLQKSARKQLANLKIDVRTGQTVTDIQPDHVMVGESRLPATIVLWSAGVQASPLGKLLGAEVDKQGHVVVDQFLHPAGRPEIFVCGDLATVIEGGKPVPGVAQAAMQMGTYAAQAIRDEISGGHSTKPFHYFDKGDLATIGRAAGVTNLKWPVRMHLSGFLAWLTWLMVHILFLNGLRNRFSVLRNWAWTFLFSREGVRLITAPTDRVIPLNPGSETRAHG